MNEVLLRPARTAALAVAAGLAAVAAMAPAAHAAEPWGFEQVTPVNKGGGTVSPNDTFQAAPDGSSLLYTATAPFEGAPTESAPQYVRYFASRGEDAWHSRALDPPHDPTALPLTTLNSMMLVGSSDDLSHVLVASTRALTPGATERGGNLYMRNTGTGELTLVATHEDSRFAMQFTTTMGSLNVSYVGSDGRSALFGSEVPLVPGAPPWALGQGGVVYSWTESGGIQAESVLPADEGGDIVPLVSKVNGSWDGPRDVIAQGDGLARIPFSVYDAGGSNIGPVYARSGGETRLISFSRIPGDPTTPVPGIVRATSRDGRYTLFQTTSPSDRLTSDTPTGLFVQMLYRHDYVTDSLEFVGTTDGQGQGIMQMSQDGQTVAFQSTAALLPGAVDWQPNYYVWRDGTLRLVAAVEPSSDYFSYSAYFLRRLSPDGRYLAFTDNSVSLAATFGKEIVSQSCPAPWTETPGPCAQVYLYDADADGGAGELSCVSCRPDDAPPKGNAGDPANPGPGTIRMNSHQARTVTDDGTVFFTSADDLLPTDTNGLNDVYEYRDGQLRLLSRAAQGMTSRFLDASRDGKTVYLSTNDPIVGTDTDRAVDVYVTREGAGYPYTAPPVDPPCTGGDCRDPFAGGGGLAPIGSLTFVAPERSGPARGAAVRVSALRAVTGARATLRVRVPAAGSIRVSGGSVRNASRRATRAATYRVGVRLSAKARKALTRRGQLKVRVKVAFRASGGSASSRTVTVTFKQPKSKRRSMAGGR
jgi:hypothetical protein